MDVGDFLNWSVQGALDHLRLAKRLGEPSLALGQFPLRFQV